MRVGYACINNTLADENVQVNRMMMKRTFQVKGLEYASQLALRNVSDFNTLIDWNISNDISFYRMSSDMFPWMSEYEFEQLPDIAAIKKVLEEVGRKVAKYNLRLTYHPGPFNVLASPNEGVIIKTIKELRQHGEVMDMIGLPRSAFAKINIHIGGAYGDKRTALDRFVRNYSDLPDTARQRLTIENDDKANMFSVSDLMYVHDQTGAPIVFDYLHHQFCTGHLTEEEALELAVTTWPLHVTPVVHFSSAKRKYEDPLAMEAAHADFIYQPVKRYGYDVDIMLEAKAKEQAVIRYREQFETTRQVLV